MSEVVPEVIKPIRKATPRQKLVARELIANGGSMRDAMRKAGYAPGAVHNPQNLTKSESFQALLDSMGLTDEFLGKALYNDIKAKPKRRVKELELAYKIKGKLNVKGDPNDLPLGGGGDTFIQININPPTKNAIKPSTT